MMDGSDVRLRRRQGWPLDIIHGKDYIEVRPEGVGKGKVIERILGKMRTDGNPADFVLCLGDDVADELMFETLNAMVSSDELPRGELVARGQPYRLAGWLAGAARDLSSG